MRAKSNFLALGAILISLSLGGCGTFIPWTDEEKAIYELQRGDSHENNDGSTKSPPTASSPAGAPAVGGGSPGGVPGMGVEKKEPQQGTMLAENAE